jgi:hypothetical protein
MSAPLQSSAPAATDPARIFCAPAEYYAWCEIYPSGGDTTCWLRDDSLTTCAIDHLWASGAIGVAATLGAILLAVLLLPRPLLLAPTAGILALVLGTAIAFHMDLTGLCGRGPDLETPGLSAWWRGEDPAIADYCRSAWPATDPIR